MKRILIIAMILTACAAQYGNAETIRLSGTDISLELLAATAATALQDSITAMHSKLETRTNGVKDTLTALHSKLETRHKTVADTLTDVHEKIELLDAMLDKIKGATGVLYEQADVPVTITAIADSGITVLNLRAATTRYAVRNLRLKSADPGANTVTITLWEFINDAFIAVDTFAITTANYTSYFSLQDMFGVPQLYGDNIMIMAQSDAGSYAITGQYSYAKTNN